MSAYNTLIEACRVITEDADALRDCHTVDGTWPPEEYAAEHEYNERMRLARELAEMADEERRQEEELPW